MMSQQFRQPEPPNKVNTFMEKAGWQIITIVCTMIATVVGLVWIGNIHILNFNWLILLVGIAQLIITSLFVGYCIKSRRDLQRKYQADVATLRKENTDFKAEYKDLFNQEIKRWHEWAVTYTQANAKEQAKQLDYVRKEYKELITATKNELTTFVKYNNQLWMDWTKTHDFIYDDREKVLFKEIDALKEKLEDRQGA